MREVKVAFSEEDLERLTAQAQSLGVSRSKLIRQRVFSAEERITTPKDVHELVQKVRRRAGFGVDHRKVEHIVMCVLGEVVH